MGDRFGRCCWVWASELVEGLTFSIMSVESTENTGLDIHY